MAARDHLSAIAIFARLDGEARKRLAHRLQTQRIARGDFLIRKNEPSDAFYIVASGLFEVRFEDGEPSGIEIGRGQPIGEIGFFAETLRSAHVCAMRDSVVLVLRRSDFDEVAREFPAIRDVVIRSLSERLASTSQRLDPNIPFIPPRVLAIVQAGDRPVPPSFLDHFHETLAARGSVRRVDIAEAAGRFGDHGAAQADAAALWLEQLATTTDFLVLVTDPARPQWSHRFVQHAEELLLVADARGDPKPNELEGDATRIHRRQRSRLVLVHPREAIHYPGTAAWLNFRRVTLHHHLALAQPLDYARLVRFVTGSATGLVACAGGAYCAAHIGVYRAFHDRGVGFDMVGGTSGGGAMAAAFALQIAPDAIGRRVEDIFIRRGAMRHFTVPRYSLLDHTHFDRALQAHFREFRVEDMAIPFFAVATDLSSGEEVCLRAGPLWEAVRASASIPGLLPPFLTDDGQVLVDGSMVNNLPLSVMHRLKAGPNIAVAFRPPTVPNRRTRYADLPDRWQIARSYLLSLGRALPPAPGLGSVIVRSMMMSRVRNAEPKSSDRILMPPLPDGMSALDWTRHVALAQSAHAHARNEIDVNLAYGDPVYQAILGRGD